MPQNPQQVNVALTPGNVSAPARLDSNNNLKNAPGINGSARSVLNITTATVVKATPGQIIRIVVVVAGSGAGTVNDATTTGAAAAANQIAVLPATVAAGALALNEFPFLNGLVIVPGTGQTIAASFL